MRGGAARDEPAPAPTPAAEAAKEDKPASITDEAAEAMKKLRGLFGR
jgi:hypothetical protein